MISNRKEKNGNKWRSETPMSEEINKPHYITKQFTCKDVWNRKEFTKKDGSTGSIQKILNANDLTLVIWDQESYTGKLFPGNCYDMTGVVKRPNRDGFEEYHTGKYSKFHLITDTKAPVVNGLTGKPMNEEPPIAGIKQLKDFTHADIIGVLARLEKKLDDLAEML